MLRSSDGSALKNFASVRHRLYRRFMVEIPQQLLDRLTPIEAQALRRVLTGVAEELPSVYADNARDQRPRDDAQIFGTRVWTHMWAALAERHEDFPGTIIDRRNNSGSLRVGPLKIGMHKVGHSADDDIRHSFPESSPTQRGYGHRNAAQLSLWSDGEADLVADELGYSLNDLVIVHFGNPEEELVKWFFGAYTYDHDGRPAWVWYAEQPTTETKARPEVTPYSEREAPSIDVKPRQRQDPPAADGTAGA
jgi:hypothetical protein